MKRWFRPVVYSLVLALALLAILGEAPADIPIAAPAGVPALRARIVPSDVDAPARPPMVLERSNGAFAPALFAVERKAAPVVAPVPMVALQPAPPADIKILGWMQAGALPHVFIEWNGESYTLTPTQSVGEMYRFEKIGDGSADFTFLPTGETRRYAVSDPALIE